MTLINTLSAPTAIPACRPILPSCAAAQRKKPGRDPGQNRLFRGCPAGPVAGWLVVLDGEAKGRDLRLGVGRTFLGLDKDGTPVTLSADAPLSLRQAVLVYDGEAKTYTLLPGSSQELCYLGDTALLEPQELAGEETLRLGTATLKFVPFCGPDFSW